MILSFGPRKELTDVVITEASAKSERPGLGAVGLGWRGSEDFIQANSQCRVNHFFQGLAQLGRTLLCL